MLDTIFNWIYAEYPMIALIIVVAVVTWIIGSKYFKHKHRIDGMQKACDEMPSISSKLDKIDVNFGKLIVFLTQKHDDLNTGLFQSFSPIQLTSLGDRLLDESGGKKFVDKHMEGIMKVMESEDFKSALDVQTFSTSIVVNRFNEDDFIDIRNYLYKNPVFKSEIKNIDLTPTLICQLIGISIRDRYFEKHPELKDVD